ncbi:hydrolase 2, exosortase A system-associated [Massilia consociata]|uniref:Hydrolase 2, exosortase A system-associated n=1 Tax=Massilia consociata TaxID=760117 RepID=A0ABV6FBW4_9BURK
MAMALPGHAPAETFFLQTALDARYCLFHAPAAPCRGALVYVHPFAEEMNRSRRMAALGARALAAEGVGVLQLDLHGCGDSSGEFAEARWDTWKQDVHAACGWLRARLGCEPGVWGLRLGALLALDYAASAPQAPERLLLWQPVTAGSAFLTQFLRLKIANDMLRGDRQDDQPGGTEALRATLRAGSALDIAGYQLSPPLAAAIDALDGSRLAPACPVHWFELAAAPDRPLPPAAAKLAAGWRDRGVDVRAETVAGPQFWNTQEITEAPALLAATAALYRTALHAV